MHSSYLLGIYIILDMFYILWVNFYPVLDQQNANKWNEKFGSKILWVISSKKD
jgi:hypothetical protein